MHYEFCQKYYFTLDLEFSSIKTDFKEIFIFLASRVSFSKNVFNTFNLLFVDRIDS